MGDDPLLEEFKVLRRRIFHWHGQSPTSCSYRKQTMRQKSVCLRECPVFNTACSSLLRSAEIAPSNSRDRSARRAGLAYSSV